MEQQYDVISEAPAVLRLMDLGKPKKVEYEDVINLIILLLIGYFVLYLLDKVISWMAFRQQGFSYRNYYDEDYHRNYETKKHLFGV